MRALLVVNPKATTTTTDCRDTLVRALGRLADVRVGYTRRRGHGVAIARQAVREGVDVVVALGGDGTVNEVVNGLLTADDGGPDRPRRSAERLPALAVVPGGSTNVFARALGLPVAVAEASGVVIEALAAGRRRTIGLGLADDRYFTFCAGLGLDAAVIHRVERARMRGRVSTPSLYLRSMLLQYALGPERRTPAILLERPGELTEGDLSTVIIQNTAPWTFVGDRPVNPNPAASFDRGLDVMALRQLGVARTTRLIGQILSRRPDPRGRHVLRLADLDEFTLISERPQAFQLDGDYLGEREKVRFTSVPAALRVIC